MKITKRKIYASLAGVFIAVGAFVVLTATTNTDAQALTAPSTRRDCTAEDIIYCGALSQAELLQDYDANQGDVQAIFSYFGIARTDLAGTTSEMKLGKLKMDGTIVVDGKTVATNAYSTYRIATKPQAQPFTVNGKTYYKVPVNGVYTQEADVFVMFKNGQFFQAVQTSCGNIITANPVKPPTPTPQPEYGCESLTATKIDRTRFRFTAAATAKNGAEIVNYTYNFGDGKTQTVTGTSVEHVYEQPGNYTVTVTVNVRVNGVIKTVTSEKCKAVVKVESVPVTPAYVCETLKAEKINRTTYKFTAAASATNGAEIVSYVYNFGDGKTQTVNSTTVNHTYDTPGTYTASVTVNVRVNGEIKQVTGANCKVTVEVKPVPVTPEYVCEDLTAVKINRTTFRFTTVASAENAQIVSYTYDFGDMTTRTVNSSSVTHAYAQPGTYTAKVSLNVRVNNENQVVTSEECKVAVTVEKAPVTPTKTPPITTPTTPPSETPTATPPVTPIVVPADVPAELPQTGIGTLASGFLGLGSLTTACYYWFSSRRSVLNALMKR